MAKIEPGQACRKVVPRKIFVSLDCKNRVSNLRRRRNRLNDCVDRGDHEGELIRRDLAETLQGEESIVIDILVRPRICHEERLPGRDEESRPTRVSLELVAQLLGLLLSCRDDKSRAVRRFEKSAQKESEGGAVEAGESSVVALIEETSRATAFVRSSVGLEHATAFDCGHTFEALGGGIGGRSSGRGSGHGQLLAFVSQRSAASWFRPRSLRKTASDSRAAICSASFFDRPPPAL